MNKLIQPYQQIKANYPDAVILLRSDDCYKTFGEDAIILSDQTGVTFTSCSGAAINTLAAFPLHALDRQLRTLVKRGYKVAICEQLEDRSRAKGPVKKAG